jgi:hypothetical protein
MAGTSVPRDLEFMVVGIIPEKEAQSRHVLAIDETRIGRASTSSPWDWLFQLRMYETGLPFFLITAKRHVRFCPDYRTIHTYSGNKSAKLPSIIVQLLRFRVKAVFLTGHFVVSSFVFMNIVGSIFIFNISRGKISQVSDLMTTFVSRHTWPQTGSFHPL